VVNFMVLDITVSGCGAGLGSADLAAGFLISFLSGGAVQKLPCWASAKAHISAIAKTTEKTTILRIGGIIFSPPNTSG
jgi:hypothetical protein